MAPEEQNKVSSDHFWLVLLLATPAAKVLLAQSLSVMLPAGNQVLRAVVQVQHGFAVLVQILTTALVSPDVSETGVCGNQGADFQRDQRGDIAPSQLVQLLKISKKELRYNI